MHADKPLIAVGDIIVVDIHKTADALLAIGKGGALNLVGPGTNGGTRPKDTMRFEFQ